MEARELRIGNLLRFIPLVGKVYSIDKNGESPLIVLYSNNKFISREITEFEPIPLTEEWLVKFGFDKWNDWGGMYSIDINEAKKAQIEYRIENNKCYLSIEDEQISKQINYVHQLQNLYFALTGEELKVTSPLNK